MLCDELDEVVKQGGINSGLLDQIDKITHSIKSIDTIEAMQSQGSYRGGSYERGGSYDDGSYRRSYERGYSRHDTVEELRAMMKDADSTTKNAIRKALSEIEQA
jgi:hypothetical protein